MSCVICGYFFNCVEPGKGVAGVGELASWKSEFRIGLTARPDGDEAAFSGVGLLALKFYGSKWLAPRNYNARWDDNGRLFSDLPNMPGLVGARHFSNGLSECFLHVRCCTLLEEFFYPDPVPVARLVEICASCPNPGAKYLGHNYDGYVRLHYENPWEELDLDVMDRGAEHDGDPCNIPELDDIFREAHLAKSEKKKVSLRPVHKGLEANFFTRLPQEILGYIMISLPTEEVKILSRTCKALSTCIPSQLEPLFWASRFQAPFEFSFIFEANKCQRDIDWRLLYFKVAKAIKLSPGLKTRRYIWDLIQSPLYDLLSLRWNGDQALRPLRTENKLKWKEVHGAIERRRGRCFEETFYRGCERFHTQQTAIPITTRQVAVTTTSLRSENYIAGLRFIPDTSPEIRIGYTSKEGSTDHTIHTIGIQGFILALGSKGVQALQVISDSGELSPWVGCPDGLLRTRRLANFKSLTALKAGFDGFKMVSLAIAEESTENIPDQASQDSLRNNALWYPEIPESHLHLNEASFVGIRTMTAGFEPGCYTLFRDTSNPEPLVKVSAIWEENYLASIDFQYSTGRILRLGHQIEVDPEEQEVVTFNINGTEGEVIKTIKIGAAESDDALSGEAGALNCFQIFTNRGRKKLFRNKYTDMPARPEKVAITPGTTVTGLYALWNHRTKLEGLGLISEFIE